MEELVKWLNDRTKEYDEGHPTVSDKEWDEQYFRLQHMEELRGYSLPESPTRRIKYEVQTGLKKVEHNHPMLSADKTKDWDTFVRYFGNHDIVGMLKLDGLTLSLRYLNGTLISAETRGDGKIGEDVTLNAMTIGSIPKFIDYKEELIIDGEIICRYSDFESFADNYANPRNFASGSIRLLDPNECKNRKLTFIPWNVVKGLTNNAIDNFNKLTELGFTVAPWTSSFDLDAKEHLIDCARILGYPIDGLVGRFVDRQYGESLGATGHHTKAIYAFKFYDEEYETTLLDIEWSLGRTGVLTPVAIYEDVDTGDSIINRASLHNMSVLDDTLGMPFKGQKIKVCKQNEIIPQITWAEKWTIDKPFLLHAIACPCCNAPTEIKNNDGVQTLWCTNPKCEGKLINVIEHFCSKKGLDVKGLSKATIEKLIDLGWVTRRADIFELYTHKMEWIHIPGFGSKSVENILDAIDGAKNNNFTAYLSSLGIPLIGQTVSQQLSTIFGEDYIKFREAVKNGYDFSNIEGFGYEMNKALHDYDYTEADEIFEKYLTIEKSKVIKTNTLSNLNVVITGKISKFKNRDEFKAEIERRGGKVSGSVTAKTTCLINNDITSTSSKNMKAKELGIPILSEMDFIQKYM